MRARGEGTSDFPGLLPASDGPVRRQAVRALLLDERDRVLLFRGCDPHRPERTFWFTPGGGIDPGETPEECLAREVREETGLVALEPGPAVWTRRARFSFMGVSIDQHETFYLARCRAFDVDTSGFTDYERASTTEHRWWTVAEIEASRDEFAPGDLGPRLADLLRDGPPSSLVEVLGAAAP
jgi:8-oxo-dGTP pyrophosphatase MutT (NUDIX family)